MLHAVLLSSVEYCACDLISAVPCRVWAPTELREDFFKVGMLGAIVVVPSFSLNVYVGFAVLVPFVAFVLWELVRLFVARRRDNVEWCQYFFMEDRHFHVRSLFKRLCTHGMHTQLLVQQDGTWVVYLDVDGISRTLECRPAVPQKLLCCACPDVVTDSLRVKTGGVSMFSQLCASPRIGAVYPAE
jgi:hypothetical protein